jgi:signal transduction histidine kinase
MTDDHHPTAATQGAVAADRLPVPVVGYALRDGEVELAGANDAFESTFGVTDTGTALSEWLREHFAADRSTVSDVCSALAAGRAVDTDIHTEGASASIDGVCRLRTVDAAGTETAVDGYCLLTERETDSVGVNRIASVISHDLRNPLDVAKAHLRAARETGDDDHFDQVEAAHDRMEQIIRDVLTLARGRGALDIATGVDIGAVATDAWATVDTEHASLTVADEMPVTEADPDRLRRLFENLFRNSIEHAHTTDDPRDASEAVEVRVGRIDEGFYVADDGPGIPAAEREHVFDPGYSSVETGGGTGLGLTIVRQVAEAHGWTVSLTTGPLGGARFEFRTGPEDG